MTRRAADQARGAIPTTAQGRAAPSSQSATLQTSRARRLQPLPRIGEIFECLLIPSLLMPRQQLRLPSRQPPWCRSWQQRLWGSDLLDDARQPLPMSATPCGHLLPVAPRPGGGCRVVAAAAVRDAAAAVGDVEAETESPRRRLGGPEEGDRSLFVDRQRARPPGKGMPGRRQRRSWLSRPHVGPSPPVGSPLTGHRCPAVTGVGELCVAQWRHSATTGSRASRPPGWSA